MSSTASESFGSKVTRQTPTLPGESLNPAPCQLKWLFILGVAGFLVSASFNYFLFQQQRILKRQYDQQAQQLRLTGEAKGGLQALVRDVVIFSNQHPDVREVLVRHGVKFVNVPPESHHSKSLPSTPSPAR